MALNGCADGAKCNADQAKEQGVFCSERTFWHAEIRVRSVVCCKASDGGKIKWAEEWEPAKKA